jgi:hypothetical protein
LKEERNILQTKKEGMPTVLVISCCALPSKTRYLKKDIRKERGDGKTRKMT